ncbi:MAG TPA: Uma2 family endonuclease [Iamia sp.]|nr:Uma2 family endonuclease [Iamia sp.]
MPPAARDKMTADEFFAAHIELPFAQLIDGELVVPMHSPKLRHQKIVQHLLLAHWRCEGAIGELILPQDMRVDDHNVFVPDLFWVPDGSVLDDGDHILSLVPPLVIEVLSPSTRHHDLGRKRRGYLESGVQEVWIIDGEADRLTVHRADGTTSIHTETVATPLVPGWVVELAEVFAR